MLDFVSGGTLAGTVFRMMHSIDLFALRMSDEPDAHRFGLNQSSWCDSSDVERDVLGGPRFKLSFSGSRLTHRDESASNNFAIERGQSGLSAFQGLHVTKANPRVRPGARSMTSLTS